jgi:site-specific DNA-methyltransferase (cytosine-N4-specific)
MNIYRMNHTTKALNSTNWDFHNASPNTGIHNIHPYPAKFIPQIPRRLIELFYPEEQSVILDPFCGSGTTLVEGIDVGIESWGIDLNPIACLISRVKTTPLPQQLVPIAHQIIEHAKEQCSIGDIDIPPIPNLDHWFRRSVQQALAVLVAEINNEQSSVIQDALQVALSSIIVRVSNQDSDTRYAAIEKEISAKDVFEQFYGAVIKLDTGLATFSDNLFRRLGKAAVLERDILQVNADELPHNVGLVITSPPYPNAYEYWLYHKYRMYWLNMDPIIVRQQEIGARPHYFKKDHQTEADFEQQMQAVFRLLSHVMLPHAKACFLVGRSIIHGRVIDNVALLQRAARANNFVVEGIVERTIPDTRKTFNPKHGKINQEHLMVFSLEQ